MGARKVEPTRRELLGAAGALALAFFVPGLRKSAFADEKNDAPAKAPQTDRLSPIEKNIRPLMLPSGDLKLDPTKPEDLKKLQRLSAAEVLAGIGRDAAAHIEHYDSAKVRNLHDRGLAFIPYMALDPHRAAWKLASDKTKQDRIPEGTAEFVKTASAFRKKITESKTKNREQILKELMSPEVQSLFAKDKQGELKVPWFPEKLGELSDAQLRALLEFSYLEQHVRSMDIEYSSFNNSFLSTLGVSSKGYKPKERPSGDCSDVAALYCALSSFSGSELLQECLEFTNSKFHIQVKLKLSETDELSLTKNTSYVYGHGSGKLKLQSIGGLYNTKFLFAVGLSFPGTAALGVEEAYAELSAEIVPQTTEKDSSDKLIAARESLQELLIRSPFSRLLFPAWQGRTSVLLERGDLNRRELLDSEEFKDIFSKTADTNLFGGYYLYNMALRLTHEYADYYNEKDEEKRKVIKEKALADKDFLDAEKLLLSLCQKFGKKFEENYQAIDEWVDWAIAYVKTGRAESEDYSYHESVKEGIENIDQTLGAIYNVNVISRLFNGFTSDKLKPLTLDQRNKAVKLQNKIYEFQKAQKAAEEAAKPKEDKPADK